MKTQLIEYTKYNLWANSMMVDFIKQIEPQLLDKKLISSFETIRLTLLHTWDAELIWKKRINGNSLTDWPSKSFKGSDEEMFTGFLECSKSWIELVQNKTEEQLNSMFEYSSMEEKKFSNKLWESVHHCMNHSTFHRGQIVSMLRNVGFTELSSTDYITYIRENN